MPSEFAVIGKSVPRPDALEKVTGRAAYLADISLPGMWIAGMLRSPVAAGRLNGITRDPSFDWSRVCVITAQDLPGPNVVAMIRDDYEILADKRISYATQPLALVAAPDAATLSAALAALSCDISPEEPVLTIEDALAVTAKVWGEDNVMDEFRVNRGDPDKAFAEADLIVERVYRTGYQEHIYLETQGMAARPAGDGIEVWGSMQCPYYVHKALVRALNLPKDKVRVRQTTTGGAFGGKEEYPSALGVWVALLALACGHPVRMVYDRSEDIQASTKRHPAKITYKMGLKKDGSITAVDADVILDGGANTSMTKVVLARCVLHATGCYRVPNARVRARSVATNTPSNGAFRGFGAPQSIYAVERQLDIAAEKLGISPFEIRMKNVLRNGDAFPYGQVMTEGVHAAEVLEDAVIRSDYLKRHADYAGQTGRVRKGIGLSLCQHGGGFTGSGEDNMGTTVWVEYLPGGRVEVLSGCTDMGQGACSVLPMMAAEALCLPFERVSLPLPDTDRVPDSGPTVASRTTMFVGRVTRDACSNLLDQLAAFIAVKRGCFLPDFERGAFVKDGERIMSLDEAADLWLTERGRLVGRAVFEPDLSCAWDDAKFEGTAYKGYSWLAQVVEVEVDLDTYEIRALESTISTEVGRAIHPLQIVGQMEGGVLQSYGWSHLEDMKLRSDGAYNCSHMNAYLIPTTLDTPDFDVKIFEVPSPVGGYGAKGIGELSCDGGAPAMAAAVANAIGIQTTDIPITGEYLFELFEQNEQV
ncbi:xanthine dehydrogenase family protein molybdopterin-binding subunit [Desulfovibrio sp. OttesenSCG-928-F20]|nr:xanthine dehydrogenase family protein molybdopterin-binding subunit [Desulfovibrio sp. OttesenSCG-928-F20]